MNYGFKVKDVVSLLSENQLIIDDLSKKRLKYRMKIANAISFANVKSKVYYDVQHIPLMLRSSSRTYLRLNYDYHLSSKLNRKILSQWYDLFLVKRRIDRLVYELKLFSTWRVHLVILVAQLEPCLFMDSYNRSRLNHLNVVEIVNNISQWRSYEIEWIIDKRMRIYDNKQVTQYLLRLKGYKLKHNEWQSIIKLRNFMKLVKKYKTKAKKSSLSIARKASRSATKIESNIIKTRFILLQHIFASFFLSQLGSSTISQKSIRSTNQNSSFVVLRNSIMIIPRRST